jgi:hypothetical protein
MLKIKVYETSISKNKNKIVSVNTRVMEESIEELCECCCEESIRTLTAGMLIKELNFRDDLDAFKLEYLTLRCDWTGLDLLGVRLTDNNEEIIMYVDVDGVDDEEVQEYYKNKEEKE